MFGYNLGYQRIVVARHERALYLRDRSLEKILDPGVYRFLDPLGRIQVQVFDLSQPVLSHPQAELFVKTAAAVCGPHLQLVETGETQVGLVHYDGRLVEVLPPQTRRVYWKGPIEVRVDVIDIGVDYTLPKRLAAVLARPGGGAVPRAVTGYVYATEVADRFLGLLIVDGELVKTLEPGFHAFWKLNRSVVVEQIDTRVQPMEVSGQEILTRDKVSLRLNLAALYQVSDAVKARSDLQSPVDWLYRELQLALRQAVGSRHLDALLGNKDELDRGGLRGRCRQGSGARIELAGRGRQGRNPAWRHEGNPQPGS